MAGSQIRQLSSLAEFSDAVQLQQRVWGFDDRELVPLPVFVVASQTGGQVFGAYDRDRMVGFCLAFAGIKPDLHPFLHSHMLAVLPEYRDQGLGLRLKLEQRQEALARGIDLIEWTFDPLELKNAYFNIERLGAIVRRYLNNEYGATSSPLHGGLPTDRCVAEWWIEVGQALRPSRRVEKRILLPGNIDQIRREDPPHARAIQAANRARFEECFANGLAVIGFERGAAEGAYLLGRWP